MMPKINTFKIKVQTGQQGMSEQVYFNFNNHKLPFDNVTGSAVSGNVFEGSFEVNSFAHSLTLLGPKSGVWDIKKISVDYDCENEKPYTVQFGAVTLDEATEVNIWQDPPVPAFDV
jgi:hypothetical protein